MKLSIITINYNNLDGLRKTIDSVINQTWQDFEWIIVDGGSTDGSREFIKETAAQLEAQGWSSEQFSGPEEPASYFANLSFNPNPSYSHRLLWCSEKDKGIYNAMNKGIVKAQGEYCLFLNSGDNLYEAETLRRAMVDIPPDDIVCFDMLKNKDGHLVYDGKLSQEEVTASFFIRRTLPHQSVLIRRSLFKKVGLYDENLRIVSDWKFFLLSLVFNNASFQYKPLKFSVIQPDGISSNVQKREAERQKVIAHYFPPRVLNDYSKVFSLEQVYESSGVCRRLYGLLYRIAIFVREFKKKHM